MKASLFMGLHNTCPSSTTFGSDSHRNTVSLVPKLTAIHPSPNLIPKKKTKIETVCVHIKYNIGLQESKHCS